MVEGNLAWEALGFNNTPDDRGIVGAIESWLSTEEADSYRSEGEDRRHHNPKHRTSKKNPEV